MASPSKQPPAPAKKSGGWGSVFTNAVAGLESRLDTILADDNEASAKVRAEEEAKKKSAGIPPAPSKERDSSRTRPNDRLAERLAKATAAKPPTRNQSPSKSADVSRTQSPALVENGRKSIDTEDLESQESKALPKDTSATIPEVLPDSAEATEVKEELPIEEPPPPSIRVSTESSTRPSIEVPHSDASPRPSIELSNGHAHKSAPELEAELSQQREDMHIYLEKIDALQAKLTYLAQQTVAAAKEANAPSTTTDSNEARLAEKDEKIALLMQEGEKLSKTELKYLQTIKKLRAKASDDEKAAAETKKKLERAEQAEKELKSKLRRAEVVERQASEKTKQIATIEKQVEELKVDRENAAELVRSLTVQLKESKEKVERVEREAREKGMEVDKGRIAALENDLEDAQIERKLAETRAEADVKKMREDVEGQKQLFSIRELELKNEVSILETRVEAMRSRAEEASADGNVNGESSVKLLRQVETLQSQYAVARENWETIEGSLNARLVAMEKERDESSRRETEARKRVREGAVKARQAEVEVEAESERNRQLAIEVQRQNEEVAALQARLDRNENALAETKAEADRQRRAWESELAQRLDEERTKWQRSLSNNPNTNNNNPQNQQSPLLNRTGSPILANSRKPSYHTDLRRPGSRIPSADLTALFTDPNRPLSRRSWSNIPAATAGITSQPQQSTPATPSGPPPPRPTLTRQDSTPSPAFERSNSFPLQTPTIELDSQALEQSYADTYDLAPTTTLNSPDRTLADLVSTSTTPTTGPSVQLVERMSALVRRLESEKAATKDEMARLLGQRDSARDEIVALMREVEVKRDAETRVLGLEREMKGLRERYEASLEMLGEREEEAEELRADVGELKRLYRELVEEKLGGG